MKEWLILAVLNLIGYLIGVHTEWYAWLLFSVIFGIVYTILFVFLDGDIPSWGIKAATIVEKIIFLTPVIAMLIGITIQYIYNEGSLGSLSKIFLPS